MNRHPPRLSLWETVNTFEREKAQKVKRRLNIASSITDKDFIYESCNERPPGHPPFAGHELFHMQGTAEFFSVPCPQC